MKNTFLLCGILALAISTPVLADPPKMKMTTPVPDGVATPNKLETSIGSLTSFDGVPDEETARKVYDNIDLQRATEAFLNCIPIASMYAIEKGTRSFGPANSTVLLFEELMDSKALWLTPIRSPSIWPPGLNWETSQWSLRHLPMCWALSMTPGSNL